MTELRGGTPNPHRVEVPKLKVLGLGEYGKALEKIIPQFAAIRTDGVYAFLETSEKPHLSSSFVVQTQRGRVEGERPRFGSPIPAKPQVFIPPEPGLVRASSNIGIITSDVGFEGKSTKLEGFEEETYGAADFFTLPETVHSISDLLNYMSGFAEFNVPFDSSQESANLLYIFNTSRPGLAPLMEYAMRSDQPKEIRWATQSGFEEYIYFPMEGSGTHLAVPVSLPANYIEFMILNEKSPHWQQGSRLEELKEAAICDGYEIPLISAQTGSRIK